MLELPGGRLLGISRLIACIMPGFKGPHSAPGGAEPSKALPQPFLPGLAGGGGIIALNPVTSELIQRDQDRFQPLVIRLRLSWGEKCVWLLPASLAGAAEVLMQAGLCCLPCPLQLQEQQGLLPVLPGLPAPALHGCAGMWWSRLGWCRSRMLLGWE